MIKYYFSFLLLFTVFVSNAQNVAVSGTIKSDETGETIIGAIISSGNEQNISNDYGFYSLSLPNGLHTITFSALGKQSSSYTLNLSKDTVINVLLADVDATQLEDVIVTSNTNARSLRNPVMGLEKLSTEEIKNVPVLLGERDLLKTIQLLPGIKSAGEGNSGFFVRGGSADQNLIVLDEATVYNAAHLLGFFSVFNSDAIKDVSVYKGSMPAQYGGRLSSVVDLKMNDGNNQNFAMTGGIGLISSRLTVEGPIQKEKSSFLISGRRTYADMFLKLSKDSALNNNKLYFYDFNAKTNFTLGKKDKLFLSGYFGKDKFTIGNAFGINWGNATGTLRWNHIFNNKLFSNTSFIYSNYNYQIQISPGEEDGLSIVSNIRDINLKQDFQWNINSKNNLKFGINIIHHTIQPGEVIPNSAFANVNRIKLDDRYSFENAVYANNNWKVNNRLNVSYGVRLSVFSALGDGIFYDVDYDGNITNTYEYKKWEVVKNYINPEPRVSASYLINNTSSLKTGYVRNVQNLHLISNSTSTNPTDKWVASNNFIKPEISDQVSLGYYKDIADFKYEINAETYYKWLQNQIDYRNGANITNSLQPIEQMLLFGIGRAYGIETQFKKKTGKLTGWVSYTLSKTEKKIDQINNNQWYNARQDRTHDLAIVATYELNPRWTLSGNWIFYTGDAVTYPAGKYSINGVTTYYYTERNSHRMPNYHRLDLSANVVLKKTKKFSSELSFGVYNAYGRENPYVINFRDNKDNPNIVEAVQTSLFRFIPSISYNFKLK